MKRICALLTCVFLSGPVAAGTMDRQTEDFVGANLLSIFFHELGHAFIDIMKLPIFGQEEDAADVLSVLLIDTWFDEKEAERIALATAKGFLGNYNDSPADVDYWDVHGPDMQRYFTFVCLFYGAKPEARKGFAKELNLPDRRAQTCKDEYRLANDSWGPVMKELSDKGAGRSVRFLADHRTDAFGKLTADVIEDEVKTMNLAMSLPKRLLVRVESCGTVNAFYDAKAREIIMCTEFARELAGYAPK
jgi:hypothetical protein